MKSIFIPSNDEILEHHNHLLKAVLECVYYSETGSTRHICNWLEDMTECQDYDVDNPDDFVKIAAKYFDLKERKDGNLLAEFLGHSAQRQEAQSREEWAKRCL